MPRKTLQLLIPAVLGLAVAMGWSDIRRYLRIKQISQGRGGHPENVPVEGRRAYAHPGDGAVDGTGDFDSASRGGPSGRP